MRADLQTQPFHAQPESPVNAPPKGVEAGAAGIPPLAAPSLETGSMADHDALVAALAAYDATPRAENAYATLTAAARLCGCPNGDMVIGFARRRAETYRQMMGQAVGQLVAAVAVSNALAGRIGGDE